MLERGPVLLLKDVLRNDVDPDIVLIGHEVEETWGRYLERDDHSVRVGNPGLLHKLLHIDAPAYFWAQVSEAVEGVRHVLCTEWYAIAPRDARAGLDGQLLEVGSVGVALRQPEVLFVSEGAVIGQGFVENTWSTLVIGPYGVRIPQLVVDPAALSARPHQGQRPVSGDILGFCHRY